MAEDTTGVKVVEPHQGVSITAIEAGARIASSLPGQFLALVILNIMFLVGLIWFLDRQEAGRISLWRPVLTACVHGGMPEK